MRWGVFGFLFRIVRFLLWSNVRRQLQKKALIAYFRAVQVVRLSLIGAIGLFSMLNLMSLGLVGVVASGLYLLPVGEIYTKVCIAFAFFLILFFVPFAILVVALSDRIWFKLAQGAKLMEGLDSAKDSQIKAPKA